MEDFGFSTLTQTTSPSSSDTTMDPLMSTFSCLVTEIEVASPPIKPTFSCSVCNRIFDKRNSLNHHHKNVHKKKVSCPVPTCPKRVATTRDMKRHLRAQHCDSPEVRKMKPMERLQCPVTGCKSKKRGFTRKDNLTKHLKKFHKELF